MDKVVFETAALSLLMYCVNNNIKMVDKIYELIKDIKRNGVANGIGKPEKLKYEPGWSRRMNHEHRLIYAIKDDQLHIISCKGHYED